MHPLETGWQELDIENPLRGKNLQTSGWAGCGSSGRPTRGHMPDQGEHAWPLLPIEGWFACKDVSHRSGLGMPSRGRRRLGLFASAIDLSRVTRGGRRSARRGDHQMSPRATVSPTSILSTRSVNVNQQSVKSTRPLTRPAGNSLNFPLFFCGKCCYYSSR